jgi:hypothetical protein
MELDEFVKDITEKLNTDLQTKQEYSMIDDIISIYKLEFNNYDEYVNYICSYNELVNKKNEEHFMKYNYFNVKYYLSKNLLSKELFEYIKLKGGVKIG